MRCLSLVSHSSSEISSSLNFTPFASMNSLQVSVGLDGGLAVAEARGARQRREA